MVFEPRGRNLRDLLEHCPPLIAICDCQISDPDEATTSLMNLSDGPLKA